jgi:hypothetical protein
MATKAALQCAAALAAALAYPLAAAAQNSAPAPAPQAGPPSGQGSVPAQDQPASAQERPAKAPTQADAPVKPKAQKPTAKADEEKDKERDKHVAVSPAPPADAASAQAECAWVGKRVVSLLVRDDVDTATDFTRFYDMFHCPETHIGATLACVVSDPGAAREGAALSEHVDLCWANPSTRLLPQKPPNPDKPAPAAGK